MKKMFLMAIVVAVAAVSVSFGQGICECQKACFNNYKTKGYNNLNKCLTQECKTSGFSTVCLQDFTKEIK